MTIPQHLFIDVPNPHTRMMVGRHAVSVGHDGFSVGTDGHVWLTALDESTFSAHSQGPLRVVSEESNVYVATKVGVKAGTTGGATIAATGGVKIIAGYDSQPRYQAPTVGIEAPSAADEVTAGCDEVATAWTIADTTVAALLTAKAAGLLVLGNKDNTAREMVTTANASGLMGIASGLAGIATNVAGMAGAAAAGVNVHAEGGINIATPAFCSIYGMGGLLMASPLNTQVFGAATVGIAGLASAGMSSLGKVDLASHKNLSAVGGKKCTVNSTFGEVIVKGGQGISIGQVVKDPKNSAQGVTTAVGFKAEAGLRLFSPSGEVRLGRIDDDIAVETQVQSNIPAAAAAMAAAEAEAAASAGLGGAVQNPIRVVQPPAEDPTLTTAHGVEVGSESSFVAKESLTLAVGPWIVTINKDGVTLGLGTATPPTGADATAEAPSFTGPRVEMTDSELTAKMMPAGGSVKLSSDSAELTSSLGSGTIEVKEDAVSISDFELVTFA